MPRTSTAPAKSLTVTPSIAITFDVADWAQAYGLALEDVWNDASEHLANIATAAVREAIDRLGVGAITEHSGTTTSVASYR